MNGIFGIGIRTVIATSRYYRYPIGTTFKILYWTNHINGDRPSYKSQNPGYYTAPSLVKPTALATLWSCIQYMYDTEYDLNIAVTNYCESNFHVKVISTYRLNLCIDRGHQKNIKFEKRPVWILALFLYLLHYLCGNISVTEP